MSVKPEYAESPPDASAHDSSARHDVVPTAITRPPFAFARLTASAVITKDDLRKDEDTLYVPFRLTW